MSIISTNLKIKTLLDGKIVVISPSNTSDIVPLFCPCCKFPMKTSDDSISYRRNGICNHCDERWTNKTGVKWPRGPNKAAAEWKEYINFRKLIEKPTIVFK